MKCNFDVDPRIILDLRDKETIKDIPAYVIFSGEVTEESAQKFIENLHEAEEKALRINQEFIPITINSVGGNVTDMFGMVDAIKSCSVKISTIAQGKIMSAGVVLFSCGVEGYRYIQPNCSVMIHSMWVWNTGKIEEIKSRQNYQEDLNLKIFKLLDENCGKPVGYFQNLLKENNFGDFYFLAPEAVKYNLANKIGYPKLNLKVGLEITYG